MTQSLVSRRTLEKLLDTLKVEHAQQWQILARHDELWAENGDALSRAYAGTNALKSSFTRSGKSTLAGR